jgi:hypothetical protein
MRYLLLLASCAAFLVGYGLVGRHEVKVRVVDEAGAPVAGATTKTVFVSYNAEKVHAGLSDSEGRYSAQGQGNHSVMLIVSKPGYYPVNLRDLSKDADHEVEMVLPRILNPIPLFASYIDSFGRIPGEEMTFPVHNQWVGFDLEAADWVAPHGKGKTADFLLRFRNEFKGWKDWLASDIDSLMAETKELAKRRNEDWTIEKFKMRSGKWDGLVEMSFPGEGEGILEAKRFISYSPMKLSHLAPEDGYLSAWKRMVNNYDGIILPEDTGFFLRTRVKKDQHGRIISANYAKFIGRMNVMANTGRVEFFYYFNPTPNDRNLEFDPKKNLFPEDKPGARVYNP